MCIWSACVQNFLVVVAMKVDVQVVILELLLFAFILFCDLWKKSTTSKNEYWFHLLEKWIRVAWYDSYASISCPWDSSHILWNVSSTTYVSAVWCPISYHHDISCQPYDVRYHIIMVFHVVSCMWRRNISCQKGIETLFDISCPLVRYSLVGVVSWILNLVMEQRYTVLVLFVLLLMDVGVSKASRHRVNQLKTNNLRIMRW